MSTRSYEEREGTPPTIAALQKGGHTARLTARGKAFAELWSRPGTDGLLGIDIGTTEHRVLSLQGWWRVTAASRRTTLSQSELQFALWAGFGESGRRGGCISTTNDNSDVQRLGDSWDGVELTSHMFYAM